MLLKQLMIYGGIVLSVVAMVVLARPIIKLWVGGEMVVSLSLVIVIGLFVLILTWVNIFAYFLNGIL